MFYKAGLHIGKGHEKEMFNFLNEHYRYFTMNSWNWTKSIANNVKVYELNLPYNSEDILDALDTVGYEPINNAISRWEIEHKGYVLGFNGRSGGYLVLYNKDNNKDVTEIVRNYSTYEEMKEDYAVTDINYMLRPLVEVVRDFDKLCDELRVIAAFVTEQYIKGYINEEDCNIPLDIEYEEIPKYFRKRLKNS